MIITTPNQYSLHRIIKILQGKIDKKWIHPELMSWHSVGTLEHISKRCGLKIISQDYYIGYEKNNSIKEKIKKLIPTYLQDGLFVMLKLEDKC